MFTMGSKRQITRDDLLKRWEAHYNPETGEFSIRTRASRRKRRTGTPVNGYLRMDIGRRTYRVHQLVWLYMTGEFPPEGMVIDHINGDRSDNRWENLRLLTVSENSALQHFRKGMRTGVQRISSGWTVSKSFDKQRYFFGVYPSEDMAKEVAELIGTLRLDGYPVELIIEEVDKLREVWGMPPVQRAKKPPKN